MGPEVRVPIGSPSGANLSGYNMVDRTEIVDPELTVSVTAFRRDRWIEFSERLLA
jgi:hypothetical protein